jgi:hypothetical protein
MATSIDSYRGRNWTDWLSAFASLYSGVKYGVEIWTTGIFLIASALCGLCLDGTYPGFFHGMPFETLASRRNYEGTVHFPQFIVLAV